MGSALEQHIGNGEEQKRREDFMRRIGINSDQISAWTAEGHIVGTRFFPDRGSQSFFVAFKNGNQKRAVRVSPVGKDGIDIETAQESSTAVIWRQYESNDARKPFDKEHTAYHIVQARFQAAPLPYESITSGLVFRMPPR